MKKILVALSMVAFLAACDDSSSASAGPNDEPGVESSSSAERGESSSSVIPGRDSESSNSEKAKSSSDTRSEAEQSSSSEKTGKSSSSVDDASSRFEFGCKTETEDNCEYGELIDDRDGQTYKAVKIGAQWWMAENLNYGTANSDCYNDNSSNCSKYGRLYTWAAAKTVCPSGWHLPSTTEFKTLFTAVGGSSTAGTVLKSTGGWYNDGNGTDAFGFSALPAGNRRNNGYYNDEGNYAYFWSSKEYDSSNAYRMYLYYNHDNAYLSYCSKDYGFSVRCVKD